MSDVDITQGRARVQVEATIYGAYEDVVIRELRVAVGRACRAINSPEALRLAGDVDPAS